VVAVGDTAPAAGDAFVAPKERPLVLAIESTSKLSIGAWMKFGYKGGDAPGTMTEQGGGKASIAIPAATADIANLVIIPNLAWVEITPKDMVGTIDFCSGQVEIAFDASFVPVFWGQRGTPMSVVTNLTTETSAGQLKTLTGIRLAADDKLKLVGVAVVPQTGDPKVDNLLKLPTDAVTDMDAHFEFAEGRFGCPR
jgi:hypothetical protein